MSNVALVDVRHADGEPWEVANLAGEQLRAAIALAYRASLGFDWAARGAWLSQEYHRTGSMPTNEDWQQSRLFGKIVDAEDVLASLEQEIKLATKSAAWDPRGT